MNIGTSPSGKAAGFGPAISEVRILPSQILKLPIGSFFMEGENLHLAELSQVRARMSRVRRTFLRRKRSFRRRKSEDTFNANEQDNPSVPDFKAPEREFFHGRREPPLSGA